MALAAWTAVLWPSRRLRLRLPRASSAAALACRKE